MLYILSCNHLSLIYHFTFCREPILNLSLQLTSLQVKTLSSSKFINLHLFPQFQLFARLYLTELALYFDLRMLKEGTFALIECLKCCAMINLYCFYYQTSVMHLFKQLIVVIYLYCLFIFNFTIVPYYFKSYYSFKCYQLSFLIYLMNYLGFYYFSMIFYHIAYQLYLFYFGLKMAIQAFD